MQTLKEYCKQPDFWYRGDDEYLKYYMVFMKTRDSKLIEEHNFDSIVEQLGGESESVVILRFGHCVCGWVEWIVVSPDMKEKAEKILEDLKDYPLLNEDKYYQKLHEATSEYWDNMQLSEKIQYCKEYKISIFRARSECIPEELFERIESFFE